jgi:hypothetical protein
VPLFEWICPTVPRPANGQAFGRWLKGWKIAEEHRNARLPKVRNDMLCFSYFTRGCVCTASGPNGCFNSHTDYLRDGAGYTKADFQLYIDWMQQASIAPAITWTAEACAFLDLPL